MQHHALDIAAANPQARLPCPVCATTVKAENLAGHVAKVHADVPVPDGKGKRWGFLPARLSIEDGAVVMRTLLSTRRVPLAGSTVEVGGLVTSRPDPTMSSYADEMNVPHDTVRTGWYLRLGDRLTIGCRTAANVKEHWSGWTQGPRRRSCDVVAPRRIVVEIEYALAAAGVLSAR